MCHICVKKKSVLCYAPFGIFFKVINPQVLRCLLTSYTSVTFPDKKSIS